MLAGRSIPAPRLIVVQAFSPGPTPDAESRLRVPRYPCPQFCRSWDAESSYVREPPFLANEGAVPSRARDSQSARVLVKLGDSVRTDHISPCGAIARTPSASDYLEAHQVAPRDSNTFGGRRGNHEVIGSRDVRRYKPGNELVSGQEGGEGPSPPRRFAS